MTDFKPGTIAKATVRGVPDVTVMRYAGSDDDNGWFSAHTLDNYYHAHGDSRVTDVRPLVVLDLNADGFGSPERAIAALIKCPTAGSVSHALAHEIEKQTRPAIEEPKGLGAVVEDDKGAKFVRIPDGSWDSIDTCRLWGEFTPVRVLSEGVPS